MEDHHLVAAMQAFINTVDSGSFSESARRIGLSQPSISRQITALENHLGVRLLQRTTRRLSLTEAGQIYYEKARLIQHTITDAQQALSSFKETPSGVLRVAAPYTWTETRIAPHLGEFFSRYPDIKLELECNDSIQDMVEERLDIVIRVGHAADSSYIAVPLAPVKVQLCASPDYLEKHGFPKTVRDLNNHNVITYDKYKDYIFSHQQKHEAIRVSGSVSLNSVEAIILCLKQGIGIAAIPDLLIKQYVTENSLQLLMQDYDIEIKGLKVDQAFAMYTSRKQMPAKVRAFLDFYKEKFKVD